MTGWDERKLVSLTEARLLERHCRELAEKYPRQNRAIIRSLKKLAAFEKEKEMNIDKVSGSMGELLGELFVYEKDIFAEHLYRMGFFLGKFIYLMDAYEDVEKDRKKGQYNHLQAALHRRILKKYAGAFSI